MSEAKQEIERLVEETQALRRRAAQLEAEAEWSKVTLHSIGDAVIATDVKGCVELMNPVAEALTGWPAEQARGRPLDEVFRVVNEETRAPVQSPVARVLREGTVVGLANHTLLLGRDGSERPIADSGAPIRDQRGETTGAVLVFRDQSDERRHQRELLHLNAVLRAIRNVNQLIARERDRGRLIQQACELLVEARGYTGAMLVLAADEGRPSSWAHAGFGGRFEALVPALARGEWPRCRAAALSAAPGRAALLPRPACAGCPLAQFEGDNLVARLVHGGHDLGLLVVSLPREIAGGPEEAELVAEVAGDLALALSSIALEQQRDRYAQIVAASTEAMALLDHRLVHLEANPSYLRLLRWPEPTVAGRSAEVVMGQQLWTALGPRLERCLAGEGACFEVERKGPEGQPQVLEASLSPCCSQDGVVRGVALCLRDATERRQAEQTLRHRLSYESLLSAVSRRAVNVEDLEQFQQQCLALLGERLGVSRAYVFEHREATDTMDNTCEWCAAGITPQRERLQGVPASAVPWWVETLRRGVPICYPDTAQIPDPGTRQILEPQGVLSILVVPLFVHGRYFGFMGFDDCLAHRDWLAEDVQILLSISRIFAGVIERKQAEETLRAERDKLRTLMQTVPTAIFIVDQQQRVVQVNPATAQLFETGGEWPGAALCGDLIRCVHRHEHPDGCGHGPSCPSCQVARTIREGLAGCRVDGLEAEIEVQSGGVATRRELVLSGAPVRIDGQPGVVLAASDVTELKRSQREREALQASLAQSDRLSTMGMLAAGVAHEINNPLSYVLYNIESLAEDLPKLTDLMRRCHAGLTERAGPDGVRQVLGDGQDFFSPAVFDDALERLREALSGTRRIKDIARSLGTFSRVERAEIRPVNLNASAEHAITMAFNEVKFRARLVKDFSRVPAVLAMEGKLAQVFLNLLINAAHAIDEGHVERNEIRVRTATEGSQVVAEVSDTGKGIAPEHHARIFDPFFTTKGVGVGSGLGLSICKSIVTSFGGRISFTSEVGQGTRFRIELPQLPSDWEEGAGQASPRAPARAGTRGRILVVDDEAGIRGIIVRLLGRDHEVLTASSGRQGRELLEHDQRFDVIFCDLMMPEMSGMELHAWLAGRDPALAEQVVFITGGAFTPGASDYLARAGNLRLEKPFDSAAFKRMTHELVLAARSKR